MTRGNASLRNDQHPAKAAKAVAAVPVQVSLQPIEESR